MCTGGPLLADFRGGTCERPDVPDVVANCLTTTAGGKWVVWAYKVARPQGDMFRPLVGGEPYPVDAEATCRMDQDLIRPHEAPDPECTCGFHALSHPWLIQSGGMVRIEVALSGRILAYEWPQAGVLFRAARQTVMRLEPARRPAGVNGVDGSDRVDARWAAGEGVPAGGGVATGGRKPDDPDGRLALRRGHDPSGAGPVSLRLPRRVVMQLAM